MDPPNAISFDEAIEIAAKLYVLGIKLLERELLVMNTVNKDLRKTRIWTLLYGIVWLLSAIRV